MKWKYLYVLMWYVDTYDNNLNDTYDGYLSLWVLAAFLQGMFWELVLTS